MKAPGIALSEFSRHITLLRKIAIISKGDCYDRTANRRSNRM